MKKWLKQLSCLLVLMIASYSGKVRGSRCNQLYIYDYQNVPGAAEEIKIAADAEQDAAKAEDAALAEVDRLNEVRAAMIL